MTFTPVVYPNYPVLNDAILEVRKLCGAGNTDQLTDDDIVKEINNFYSYKFPAEFRSLKLKDKYTFNTTRGIDTYAFDSEHYTTVESPCYCAKQELFLFYNPINYWGTNYNWQNEENFDTGDGTTGPFTGTTLATPLRRSVNNDPGALGTPITTYPASRVQNILITTSSTAGVTYNVTDDGAGNLIQIFDCTPGSGGASATQYAYRVNSGSINYNTGAISVTFRNSAGTAQIIAGSQAITIQYNPLTLATPQSILFWQNQFTLSPCPDQGYTIELTAYRQPVQALIANTSGLGNPELSEWWETLAIGAAKKIYEDRFDETGAAFMKTLLNDRYNDIEVRTYAQLGPQRVKTIYGNQMLNGYYNQNIYG